MGLFDPDRSASRLPVSVITGFLGSGKTTLLNKLLRHPGMGDSAVIINEFGEVGLDHLLVEAVEGEIAVLTSGCVCCTLRSDLQQAQSNLDDRKVVERAKGLLMKQRGYNEPEAYRLLHKLAMDRKRKLADVARNVLDVADLLEGKTA